MAGADIARKLLDILLEIESYENHKQRFLEKARELFKKYQQGKFTYFEYKKAEALLLKGKTKKQWVDEYNAYIYGLFKKMETLNDQMFYQLYEHKKPNKQLAKVKFPDKVVLEKTIPSKKDIKKTIHENIQDALPKKTQNSKIKPVVTPTSQKTPFTKLKNTSKSQPEKMEFARARLAMKSKQKGIPKAPTKNWLDKFIENLIPGMKSKTDSGRISLGKLFSFDIFKIAKQRTESPDVIADKTSVGESTIRMESRRRHKNVSEELKEQIETVTATALTEEAKRIKSILSKREAMRIYKPTFFGSLANVTTKKLSLYILEQFPGFFRDLYHSLRLANITILSNTYVNMMVFSIIVSMVFGFVVSFLGFAFAGLPPNLVVSRTILTTIMMGVFTFAIFYVYPNSRGKSRKASLNTNMPFAINHMAAVASSGVPPTKMFKLISESTEYGEIAKEAEKIDNYVEMFGYDFLMAVKSVSATTPSPAFREFFEGLISTVQSGGDVKDFLRQKADEAMEAYKLERKKYSETISTYSDVYTGILIAAPLFFVAALSLVSMLGGKLGNTDVNTVIVIGTYMVIPFLNLAFLMFLRLTQPEV